MPGNADAPHSLGLGAEFAGRKASIVGYRRGPLYVLKGAPGLWFGGSSLLLRVGIATLVWKQALLVVHGSVDLGPVQQQERLHRCVRQGLVPF